MNPTKIYLAIPYSRVEDLSFRSANEVAAILINQGHLVFSPISHSHPIHSAGITISQYEIWLKQDRAFVEWADEIHVILLGRKGSYTYGLDLVQASYGVQSEMQWAKDLGKPIRKIFYDVDEKKIEWEE